MKKLRYTPVYKEKIEKLRKYLDVQFGQDVRKGIFLKLHQRLKMLKSYEDMGISVRDMFGIDCDYRYLYVIKNYIFYLIEDDAIYIIDIYNEREDFMMKMFGIKTTSPDTEEYWDED